MGETEVLNLWRKIWKLSQNTNADNEGTFLMAHLELGRGRAARSATQSDLRRGASQVVVVPALMEGRNVTSSSGEGDAEVEACKTVGRGCHTTLMDWRGDVLQALSACSSSTVSISLSISLPLIHCMPLSLPASALLSSSRSTHLRQRRSAA